MEYRTETGPKLKSEHDGFQKQEAEIKMEAQNQKYSLNQQIS